MISWIVELNTSPNILLCNKVNNNSYLLSECLCLCFLCFFSFLTLTFFMWGTNDSSLLIILLTTECPIKHSSLQMKSLLGSREMGDCFVESPENASHDKLCETRLKLSNIWFGPGISNCLWDVSLGREGFLGPKNNSVKSQNYLPIDSGSETSYWGTTDMGVRLQLKKKLYIMIEWVNMRKLEKKTHKCDWN